MRDWKELKNQRNTSFTKKASILRDIPFSKTTIVDSLIESQFIIIN